MSAPVLGVREDSIPADAKQADDPITVFHAHTSKPIGPGRCLGVGTDGVDAYAYHILRVWYTARAKKATQPPMWSR